MTLKEVAEYLRIHQTTLRKLIRRGEILGFKIGSDYRFRQDEIEKWLAEKQRSAAGAFNA
jgi:excisionase family DNA binding protein